MKKVVRGVSTASLVILSACTLTSTVVAKQVEMKPQFVGTWQLLSGEYVDHNGELINYADLKLKSLKTINANHFSFITKSGDEFWSAGAGTYQVEGNLYIETPIHTSYKIPANQQYTFSFELKGDKWYSSRFDGKKRVEYEVWQRVIKNAE
ncbi:hypothetical protein [Psychrobium sp. 1_MG-2023]|uniref:hypothetical protein n=1 Tax=Psychrobium sp. 1_MG-2023 TaxID=3062624 RepID=UPI000C334EF5|nr:hypothetical protein [Psychrobium sp. 1_MG-2023]MDP2562495.1 hypothetical protein [Psychrobium sp. 1_MG-2023]PKF54328.1 hypothetical protein CW748_16505 [Alteromonadales bacterium alter-6D02]